MVGVGWVVYAGQWLQSGGILGAVLAFVIGGIFLIPVGKCYAELTAALPVTGGEVAFTYKAFGSLTAFFTAWALSLGYISITPFETIATGTMVEAIFPSLATSALYEIGGYRIAWSTIIPGVCAAVWIIWLNWRGAKNSARFQTVVMVGMLITTGLFCVVAFWKGELRNLQPLFVGDGQWWAIAPASIASVLVVVPFFLTGFDCIPQAAEEAGLKMPSRQLGTAIVTTIVIGMVFYVLVILALGVSVSGTNLQGIVADKDKLPMAAVFRESFHNEWAAKLVLLTALLGIVSTLNGMFMAATRLLFAQGRGGLLPHWFAELHPVHHTPKNAILFVGTLAILGPFFGKAGLLHIVNSYSFVISCVLLVTAICTLRLRRIAPDLARPYRIHILTIWCAIAVGLFLVGLMVVPGSPGQMEKAEFITVAIWLAVGTVFYFYRQKERGMSSRQQAYMILGEYP